MDEFHFGAPGRRGPRVHLDPRLFMVVGGLLAAALAVYGFLSFVSKGGHDVAESQATAVQQIDRTRDIQAKQNEQTALLAAKTYFNSSGSYSGINAAELAGIEPSLHFVDGPSTDVAIVSVGTDGSSVAFAVLAPSGTCFYAKDSGTGGETFGSGATCTGQAAFAGATSPTP